MEAGFVVLIHPI